MAAAVPGSSRSYFQEPMSSPLFLPKENSFRFHLDLLLNSFLRESRTWRSWTLPGQSGEQEDWEQKNPPETRELVELHHYFHGDSVL